MEIVENYGKDVVFMLKNTFKVWIGSPLMADKDIKMYCVNTVSYTHLTLPTKLEV